MHPWVLFFFVVFLPKNLVILLPSNANKHSSGLIFLTEVMPEYENSDVSCLCCSECSYKEKTALFTLRLWLDGQISCLSTARNYFEILVQWWYWNVWWMHHQPSSFSWSELLMCWKKGMRYYMKWHSVSGIGKYLTDSEHLDHSPRCTYS